MRRVRLMGAWEIQQALGLGRTRAREIMFRKGFPDPADDTLKLGIVWYEDEVLAWIAANRPPAEDPS
ncbi:hypothetical protein [Actinoplanes palleronii]|uniref:AlpA family transcriptional regulator n=1 Tax=Actinoplanes palleronii TaxID=113570 RepID=A0ABQ4B425_9ACTN|nr:hypothetical protein [Actinoplanes palleronii]GIE65421.1 hypothetical protein Apa02nite_015290 [Actinoplanes palleronii]